MKKNLFILGVADPEMRRIEEILEEHGFSFSYATKDGRRVHPGNAYQSDPVEIGVDYGLTLVECQPINAVSFIRIDHHRTGDLGYGLPPARFWEASSIGQIYSLLRISEIPHEDLILAAMDHCPSHAIRGECPGVSAEEVLERKVQEIANGTKNSHEVVRSRIAHYSALLESSPEIEIGGVLKDLRQEYLGEGYSLNLLSAQTAALAGGYAVLLRHRDAVGKPEKWSISGHGTSQECCEFMQVWGPANGLDPATIYGVPERGYAGGYLKGNE